MLEYYEPFDYYEDSKHSIREIAVVQYQSTPFKPWRQVKPKPSLDLVLEEPRSEILIKLQLAIEKDNPYPKILGSALAFPPDFWKGVERERDLYDHAERAFKIHRSSFRAEEQRKRNEKEGTSANQEIRKNPDQ